VPNIQSGHVIKVYDGDTITIASKLPYADSPLYRFQVRLRGIDCPEIHGKTEDEKSMALCARTEMETLVMQKTVILKNVGTEKYGRLLADVYINDIHVNSHMLQKGLALPYSGKTKTSWAPKL
jgi:endonuclease YncB( thermonuclease family)